MLRTIVPVSALAVLVAGCPAYVIGDADPNPQKARETHGAYLKGGGGFDLDPSKPLFYDSFEESAAGVAPTKWEAVQPGANSVGDTWKNTSAQTHFGSRALTYGASEVIEEAADFGKTTTLTTKDTISLAAASDPRLVMFAGFLRTGQESDQTAIRVEVSPDLGFTWTGLVPTGAATDSISEPVVKPGEGSVWKRFTYSLAPYKGQSIRLRLTLSATANSRKLVFIDDVLVADTK